MAQCAVLVYLEAPTLEEKTRWETLLLPALMAITSSNSPCGLVLSGRMIEELSTKYSDVFVCLKQAVRMGRVELLATALEEPILSAIPQRDAVRQYQTHVMLLKRFIGVRPTGAWIPEGVWAQDIPQILRQVRLIWTSFACERLVEKGREAALRYSIEHLGRTVAVLPTQPLGLSAYSGLRVSKIRSGPDLQTLIAALPRVCSLPSDLVKGPMVRTYVQTGDEHGLWESRLLLDRGADTLHQRMLRVSRGVQKLATAVESTQHSIDGPDPRQLEQARRYLFRAQSRRSYGKSGRVRDLAWRDLLRTETVLDCALETKLPSLVGQDIDCDGVAELCVRTETWVFTVCPSRGGALSELSLRTTPMNVLCGENPVAFRERWNGQKISSCWEVITHEALHEGVRVLLYADSDPAGGIRLTKTYIADRRKFSVKLHAANRGDIPLCGRLSTELFLTLGGERAGEQNPMSVELAGGRVPLDESIELPQIDAVAVIGWRGRVDLELSSKAIVSIEPQCMSSVRVEIVWSVELFPNDSGVREVVFVIREMKHG